MCILIKNIDKLHATETGAGRVRKNLQLEIKDVIPWCKEQILSSGAKIERFGQNWYVTTDTCKITVSVRYTVLTAHRVEG